MFFSQVTTVNIFCMQALVQWQGVFQTPLSCNSEKTVHRGDKQEGFLYPEAQIIVESPESQAWILPSRSWVCSKWRRLFLSLSLVCVPTLSQTGGLVFSINHISFPKTILATSCSVNKVLCIFWEAALNTAQGCSIFFSLEILCKSGFFNWLFGIENDTEKEMVN